MVVALTQFGAKCREHRNRHRKTMLDQAGHFGCDVPHISAIELGERTPSVEYSKQFSDWLGLSTDEGRELQGLAVSRSNILRFRQRDEGQAAISRKLFRKINRLSPSEIRGIGRRSVKGTPPDG